MEMEMEMEIKMINNEHENEWEENIIDIRKIDLEPVEL